MKIWKLALGICSTIPKAEANAGGGSLSVPEENEDKTPVEFLSPMKNIQDDIGSIGPVTWEIRYILFPTGKVPALSILYFFSVNGCYS